MSDKRPARSRKKVDYAKFGDGDDFDDDFADLTPPPAKRPKTAPNELQRKVTVNQEKKKPKKGPLEEKIFDRELQAALELSLLESQGSNCDDDEDFKPKINTKSSVIKNDKQKYDNSPKACSDNVKNDKQKYDNSPKACSDNVKNQTNEVICTAQVNEDKTDVTYKKEDSKPVHAENNVNTHDVLHEKINTTDGNDSDGITVLEDEEITGRAAKRKSTTKTKVILDNSDDNDSEFAADDNEDDDSEDEDYDDENDSDFDCGGKKKKKVATKKSATPIPKKQTKTKAPAKAASSGPGRNSTIKAAVSVKGTLSSPSVASRPVVRSPASRPVLSSPVVRTVPKWNPPGSAGSVKSPLEGVSMKSPSSGMRVGLSRNQRVRSLHPGLTLKTT